MMVAPAVRLRAVNKSFDGLLAVDDLSFDVDQGEILAILGPSGCGKTTLLRMIAGFEQPDLGLIRINGRTMAADGRNVPPEERRVGMVFQSHALFPHLSVADNIAFGLPQMPPGEVAGRVQHLLNLIRLPRAHERFPHELSGGQRQRVALARALAPEPVIVLMDEPFSNLDADQRIGIRDEVRFILKQMKTTVIFVTHDQEEALFMGDRMGVMRGGRLVQLGPPEQVFRQPATQFTAEFLGQAEFLPAKVTTGGLQSELGELPQSVSLPPGAVVEVGFRADDLDFAPDPMGEAVVLARFFRGADCLYRLRLPSGRIVHSMQPHYRSYSPGTAVRVWFAPNHALPCFRQGQAVETDLIAGGGRPAED